MPGAVHADPTGLAVRAVDLDPSQPSWPRALDDLEVRPTRLRVAGALPPLDRAIAIVGTRRASEDGLAIAARLAAELAAEGATVISGGAEGVDAAAHRSALEAGGPGIVVLAGGLARPYPRAHAPLFARIANHGAVISEAPDHVDPRPHAFLARNRLIAALARATVVVQAPLRSGALSTAAHARRLGRTVLAVPWALGDPRGEGCVALLADGAPACRDARDVLRAIGAPTARPRRAGALRCTRPLGEDPRAVLAALRGRPAHVDDLVSVTGLPAARVQIALTELLLLGLAAPDPSGAYRALAGQH
jgi:DNA processing protein